MSAKERKKEERREEWFTCIASIALAQGQRVCETEDQTGSGPPSFQFSAPCSLTALLPLALLLRAASDESLFSFAFSVLRPSAIRKQLHYARALPLLIAYYMRGRFFAGCNAGDVKNK